MQALNQHTHLCLRRSGLRQSRYIGLKKTHMMQVFIACALNLVRLDAWLAGIPLAQTRSRKFQTIATTRCLKNKLIGTHALKRIILCVNVNTSFQAFKNHMNVASDRLMGNKKIKLEVRKTIPPPHGFSVNA